MAKLKVYAARQGFHDTVVAAASQAKALAAWGTRQNLFGEGLAAVTDDPAAVEAALAQPGVVLRRPAGSDHAFGEGQGKIAVPKRPKRTVEKTPPAAKTAPRPPRPSRSALDKAEDALKSVEDRYEQERHALQIERDALELRRRRLEREHDKRRSALDDDLKAARDAFGEETRRWESGD